MKTKIAKRMSASTSTSYPKSMGNEALEERLTKSKKQVFITVYVESLPPPSIHGVKKTKSNKSGPILISKSHTGIYDRRAHLLAYAQELRQNTGAKLQEWPENCSYPKPKEKKLGSSSEPKSSTRVRSQKRYHRLVAEVDISCRPKSLVCSTKKKKRANRLNSFRFVVKLTRIFRGLCKE